MVVADVIIDFLILKRDFGMVDVNDDEVHRVRINSAELQIEMSDRERWRRRMQF